MEYLLTQPDPREFGDMLPKSILEGMEKNSSFSMIATEDEEFAGIAVFEDYPKKAGYMLLTYIYVIEKLRGHKFSRELLAYAEEFFKNSGYKGIYVKVVDSSKEIEPKVEYLKKAGYLPLSAEGHFVSYYMQDLRECIMARKLEAMSKLMEFVKFYREVSSPSLKEFSEELKSVNKEVDFNKIDLLFCSFYLDKNKVKGFMHLDEIEENILLMSDTYIASDEKNPYILPAMLANALKISIATMPDEAMLYLNIERPNDYKGVITAFGEPEHDDLVYEFTKLL